MRARSICLLTLPLLLAACGPKPPELTEGANPTRNVVVQLVKPQPLNVKIKLPVVIEPKETLELRAAAPGKITALSFKEGDTIPASKVPAAKWLDVDEYLAALPEGSPKPTDDEIVFRNLEYLKGFKCFARIDDSQLKQNFREAQASYDQAVRDLQRAEDYKESTPAQLDQARTRRNIARASAERVRAMIEETYTCNPMQGVLTERMHQTGEYVNMGELIGKVAVMDRLVAELDIPEAHRHALKLGENLQVEIASVKGDNDKPIVRDAVITRLDSVAHPVTHSFTVELEIPNENLELPAGVFGTTRVTIYSRPDALVVPLTALNLKQDSKSLFVLPASGGNQVRELKNIELGQLTSRWVEIRGDKLKPGMRVVTFGAQMLGNGDEVNWTEQDPYVVAGDGESQS
jgi:RND family efflux transporter MFP subunit